MNPVIDFVGDVEFGRVVEEHPRKVGYAFRNAANETVYEVQQQARRDLDSHFTVRNQFTGRGIVFDRARIPDIDRVEAAVGGKKDRYWLKLQEQGFTSDKPQASESMRVSSSYKRAVRSANYLKGARFRSSSMARSKASSPAGKARAMLAMAYRQNYGMPGSGDFFYLRRGELFNDQAEGYYQFSTATAKGYPFPNIRLAYRLSNDRRVSPEPWLEDAIDKKGQPRKIYARFEDHLRKQLNRR